MKGRIVVTDSDFNLKYTVESLDFSAVEEWYSLKESELKTGAITQADFNKFTNPYFNGPTGVYVDIDEGKETIYVADNANDRVVQFTATSTSLQSARWRWYSPDRRATCMILR